MNSKKQDEITSPLEKSINKVINLNLLSQMDISAVLNANDDTLKDMGLLTAAPLKRSNTRKKRNPKDEDYLRHSCLQRKIGPLSL